MTRLWLWICGWNARAFQFIKWGKCHCHCQEKPRDNRDPGTMTSLSFSINYTVTIVGYAKGSIERGLLIDRGRMRIQQLCWRTLQFRRTHPGLECVGESGHL